MAILGTSIFLNKHETDINWEGVGVFAVNANRDTFPQFYKNCYALADKLDDKQMLDYAEYLLASFCMPTLLRKKPSSLIRVNIRNSEFKDRLLQSINSVIGKFDCDYYILYENTSALNLLIFHRELLRCLLATKEIRKFFITLGYELKLNDILLLLSSLRIKLGQYYENRSSDVSIHSLIEFPHEIGIILGYPIQDVRDFIKYQGKNYILCGCWKVYHNAEDAVKIFEDYKQIRHYAMNMLHEGKRLELLTKEQL